MDAFVSALTTAFSADVLWGIISSLIPFILGVTLFALGLYFVRKAVRGVQKGKARF